MTNHTNSTSFAAIDRDAILIDAEVRAERAMQSPVVRLTAALVYGRGRFERAIDVSRHIEISAESTLHFFEGRVGAGIETFGQGIMQLADALEVELQNASLLRRAVLVPGLKVSKLEGRVYRKLGRLVQVFE